MRAVLFCIVGERAQHHIVAGERHGDFFEDRAHEYHIKCEQKHAHDGDCYAEEQAGRAVFELDLDIGAGVDADGHEPTFTFSISTFSPLT